MLELHIPGEERWDERTNMFVYDEPVTLRLEYSLLSLSKWESKWHKPYLDENVKKTREETLDFVRCMTLTKGVDPTVYTTICERLKGKRVRFALEDNPSHYYEGLLWVNQFKSDKGHSKITLEYRLHPTMYTLKVEAMALNVYELKLNRGMEYQLLVGVGPVNTFYRRVNVTAAPKNVVKITQNGTILALKKGTAVVTAECGGVKAECSVTVGEFETCTIERDLHGVVETNTVGSVVKGMSYQNVFTMADTENFTLVLTAMRLKTMITSGEDGSMNVTEEWVPVDAGCIVTAKDGTSAEFKMASVTENIKITANATAKPVAAMLCADILPVEVKPLKQADGRFRLET